MPAYVSAGADAARDYDAEFRAIIEHDPDVQAVIQRVWGTGPRPSDTPKHLEQANHAASQEIGQILARKGITLPDRSFVNPRSGALEGHRGWAGLSGWQKAAIVAAAAATGVGGLAAAGALGGGAAAGAAGAGASGSGLGVTSGLGSLAGAGATGVGAGGAALGGGSALTSALTGAGINAAKTKLTGGSWRDALTAAGTGAATGGLGGSMNWADLLKQVATNPDTYSALGSIAGTAAGSKSNQRMQQNQLGGQFNNAEIARYQTEQAAQNQAGQLDLQRKMFSEDARAGRGKQAALADLLSNLQDISINVPGIQTANVTGGLRPSAMGATGRQGMAELSKQALAALMSGDQFTGGEMLKGPQITAPASAGGLEQGLDWMGLLGSVVGGVGKSLKDEEEEGKYSALPGNASSAKPWGGRI